MVGYGKSIVKAERECWKEAYLDYADLKAIISRLDLSLTKESIDSADKSSPQRSVERNIEEGSLSNEESAESIKHSFFEKFKSQIEMLSLFILQQQGHVADSVGALRFVQSHVFNQKSELVLLKNPVLDASNALNQYSILGVELLHLLKFVCVNSIGVQKILKKYNKCFERFDEPYRTNFVVNGDHLQQLAYSPSIRAIESSLESALIESTSALTAENQDKAGERLRVIRFQCVMSCYDLLRRKAELLQQPFLDFLSRKALTGTDLGGMRGSSKKALEWLIQLQPDKLLAMTESQLEELWSTWSGGPAATAIPKQTKHRRKRTLADMANLEIVKKELVKDERLWGGVNAASMALNLLSTLLYTINYYIIAPTANHYAIKLGADGAIGSALIGASSFSAIFAAFVYSFWYTKSSFKSALLFSAVCPVLGNLFYALAISFRSMPMAFFGRILCGFGSAEVVNRQLISACVNFEGMTKASALFVAAGAMGMSIGPLLAGILDIASGRDSAVDIKLSFIPSGGIIYNHITSPGFVMAALWLMEVIALFFLFAEPSRINGAGDGGGKSHENLDEGTGEQSSLLVDGSSYGSLPAHEKQQDKTLTTSAWSEVVATVKLIVQNPGLPLTVLLFGYIEMTDEVLISSCSMVVRRYFVWNGAAAGFLIAALGALVLPAHFVVEKASHYYSERNIMSKSMLFLVVALLGITNWSGLFFDIVGKFTAEDYEKADKRAKIAGQELDSVLTPDGEFLYDFGSGPLVYIVFLSAVFMGTIVLEGVDTSIMAKVTPAELNDRFFNCGLLATLVGTLGRVLADGMITMSALVDIHILMDFVNATFLPLLVLTIGGWYLVRKHYTHLV